MAPILEQFKGMVGQNATILKVDVDKNPEVAKSYNIQGAPTLILFKEWEDPVAAIRSDQASQLKQVFEKCI